MQAGQKPCFHFAKLWSDGMGDTNSGRGRTRMVRRPVSVPTPPDWKEAFSDGWDYQRSRDVDHVSRTVSRKLQQRWDAFSQPYQTGVTQQDLNNIMGIRDWSTGETWGYVRTRNSFAINEKLYDPANANKTDDQIFTRTRRDGRSDLATVQTMDKLINNHRTQTNATYTRFSTANAVQALYGLNDAQMRELSNAGSMNQSQLFTLNKALAGKTSYSASYTSTSANRSMNAFGNPYAKQSKNMWYERKLYMPQGTNAYAVQRNAQESEVIFGRHANTSLMKITIASDGHIVLHEMFTGYKKR